MTPGQTNGNNGAWHDAYKESRVSILKIIKHKYKHAKKMKLHVRSMKTNCQIKMMVHVYYMYKLHINSKYVGMFW